MNKRGLAMSSLVMAIPAGFLAYISVRSVFEMNESMPMLVTIIVWSLIVISGLLALSPFVFLIAGPSGNAVATAPAPMPTAAAEPKKKAGKKSDEEDEFGGDGEEVDDQLFDASDAEAGADDFEDNFNFDDDDEVAFDDEEEEPAPKKKKKK